MCTPPKKTLKYKHPTKPNYWRVCIAYSVLFFDQKNINAKNGLSSKSLKWKTKQKHHMSSLLSTAVSWCECCIQEIENDKNIFIPLDFIFNNVFVILFGVMHVWATIDLKKMIMCKNSKIV